jgi:hypothetical protein
MTTCATCRHWQPSATPVWAARMHMAVCELKNTKAVTMSHWHTCPQHRPAAADVQAARVVWLNKHSSDNQPEQP